MNKKLRSRFSIHVSDIACGIISVILGSLTSPLGFVLTFLYLTYAYMRNAREAMILICLVLLFSLERGIFITYVYALAFAAYFVLIHALKMLNQNLYQWIAYITTLLCSAFSIQYYGFHALTIIIPIVSYTFMRVLLNDYSWMNKAWYYPPCMRGFLIYAIALLLMEVLPLYKDAILMVAMLFIAYTADEKTTIIFALSAYFLITTQNANVVILASVLAIFKYDKKNSVLLLIGAFLLFPYSIEMYLYLILCVVGLLFVNGFASSATNGGVLQNQINERISHDSILKRQMQNYANIFQSLSDYYAQINDVQAEILENMANALQYNADAVRKVDVLQQDISRIQKALEGYQYDVKNLLIEEPKEGRIQVSMDITNIKRGEIRSTLLPLLEVLLHRNLEVEDIKSKRFFQGYHHISICDHIPFEIDAYADSVKNSYTSSGDTFSIFKFRQSMVCMISDGMGNGDRAAQSSRLITNIFQRMMVSGITQDSAIKCINKLIQSDTYATLDVICFNRSQGVAYISKSAACPTFLLRDKEVYEINGNALPVGIISQMQPDCFRVELKAGDEYLMVSDGIYMNEIYTWLKEREGQSVKDDIEVFTEILQKSRRKDDSTMVLARVNDIA